jgi:hypothetical protein
MDQSDHSVSSHDLDARLGTSGPVVGVDACCVRTAIDAERLFLLAVHCFPDTIEKDIRTAAVIKLLPLAGTECNS